ncbi:MAG: DeoR/GlpR transcriptional regulator [Stomatobaculum sp.]|nr:DeoR/GlpR transcriptional regulator [Stomatobaculum sp.]
MSERQKKILELLETQGSVSIASLSELFGCSLVTIRNDIRELESQGQLERTRGGAKKVSHAESAETAFPSLQRNTGAKQRIAARAYDYISENSTILLDDSSASYFLAQHISRHPEKAMAVLTNSLPSATVLAGCPHVQLYLIGGHVGGHLPATMGEQTTETIRNVFVDMAFISVHSINFNVGLTSIGTPQMQIKRAILDTTDKVFVLADSAKFGAGYLEVICPLSEVYRIITDSGLKKEYIDKAEAEHIPLELC